MNTYNCYTVEDHSDTGKGYTLPFQFYSITASDLIHAAQKVARRERDYHRGNGASVVVDRVNEEQVLVRIYFGETPQWVIVVTPAELPARPRAIGGPGKSLGKMPQ